jgi:epoxyqueuosine reductase
MALTAAHVKAKALELGFDACGIAPAADHPELAFFSTWLSRGYAGTMGYLPRSARRRADVRNVMPSARVVIATATVYNTAQPYSTESADPDRAEIARYAWGEDYHDVIGQRLELLIEWMRATSDAPFEARAYVDTGPVQERVYAQYAGLGWIGKNTCLINPALGSWILLGEIICSLPLETDAAAFDQCGTCTLCLEACPTRAFVAPGELDATRCISYLTIEYRGALTEAQQQDLGAHVYGCDICQEVCPWNQQAPVSADPAWQPRPLWRQPTVDTLASLSDTELEDAVAGSAMSRARVSGLRRNLDAARRNRRDHDPSD